MADNGIAPEEAPILCETCLGSNPFVRMNRERFGKACKICDRPFTIYRWKPAADARYKKTEVCQTCAKLKNVCQTCVLDLQFGLPVQVRDSALAEANRLAMPESDVGRQFMIEQHEKQIALHGEMPYGKAQSPAALAMLERIAKARHGGKPYYQRNMSHLCSFFAAGTCTRGDACPYRHEMPLGGDLAKQNIKDRFFGQDDPVAKKILNKVRGPAGDAPLPPADLSIVTLWVGNVDEKMSEQDMRELFGPYGDVTSVRLVPDKGCGFVTFADRKAAEQAAAGLWKTAAVNGTPLKISWGKRQLRGDVPLPPGMSRSFIPADTPVTSVSHAHPTAHLTMPAAAPVPSSMPAPPGMKSGRQPYYASMDSKNLGAKLMSQ